MTMVAGRLEAQGRTELALLFEQERKMNEMIYRNRSLGCK